MKALKPSEIWGVRITFLLLFISLFINLGLNPLHFEEPRRALISLEMRYNENYIVPTQTGEFYYNKPPIFNWLLLSSAALFQADSEFAFRFVTVLSYILMVLLVYVFSRPHLGERGATYTALFLAGAMHLYIHFTRLAEIDIFYSLITFASFVSLFHFYQKQQYFYAFASTYFIGSLGMLTKGFPSIVFLGISILTLLAYHRDWKRLFSWAHIGGGLIFLFVVGLYFALYTQYNSLENYFYFLWRQSSERTPLEKSFLQVIIHLFTFPFRFCLNTFPGSLLIVFTFRKDFWQVLNRNAWAKFCFFMFLSNIIVYWISPGARPRYVYMFYPLFLVVLTHFYLASDFKAKAKKILEGINLGVLILVTLATLAIPFIPNFAFLGGAVLWTVSLTALAFALGILFVYFKRPNLRLVTLVMAMVLVRWVVDFTVIPDLARQGLGQMTKQQAVDILDQVKEQPLYIYQDSEINFTTVFYIERARKQVLSRKYEVNSEDFFLVETPYLPNENYQSIYQFEVKERKFHLLKFK